MLMDHPLVHRYLGLLLVHLYLGLPLVHLYLSLLLVLLHLRTSPKVVGIYVAMIVSVLKALLGPTIYS